MANDQQRQALRSALTDAHERARTSAATTQELLEVSRRLSAQLAQTVSRVRSERRQRQLGARDPRDRAEE
jgi:hypothetical protein